MSETFNTFEELSGFLEKDYFEANIYDTKCICVNSKDTMNYNVVDRKIALGYDILVKFHFTNKRWIIYVFNINQTVNIKIFCENRNGKGLTEQVGIIECDHLSDFFKDML